MRIAFAGTPAFAAVALDALIRAGHDVRLVLSQPDRPSGRGMKLKASEVKTRALESGIPVLTPRSLNTQKAPEEAEEALSALEEEAVDVLIVAAYGLILPERALNAACGIGLDKSIRSLNIHASLLPRWRGAAPVQRAIESGDPTTGVCLMKMDKGLDTGDVVSRKELAIAEEDTADTLTDKLAALGAEMVLDALGHPDELTHTPQATEGVTYASKLLKAEGAIDWSQDAAVLCRKIRAFNPFPSVTAQHVDAQGTTTVFKIWNAEPTQGQGIPGTILCAKKELIVACGKGALRCTRLQKPGKSAAEASSFLQSFPLSVGEVLR